MNYMQSLAQQIRNKLDPELVPDGETDTLFLSYATLLQAKGAAVTNADVHNAWVAWMTGIDPDHEALIPYDALPHETKVEDSPFTVAIRSVAIEQD